MQPRYYCALVAATVLWLGAGLETLAALDLAYIAASYDGTHNYIWINGQEVASRQAEGGLNVVPVEQQPVCLGIDPACYFRSYYDGLMDEVMIFSRALPAEQMASLYQATVVGADLDGSRDSAGPGGVGVKSGR